MAEDLKQVIIDYVKREYLDEDSDEEITAETSSSPGVSWIRFPWSP